VGPGGARESGGLDRQAVNLENHGSPVFQFVLLRPASCPWNTTNSEDSMAVNFRHDVERVLEEAKEQKKPVILDFSAAPM
jgi:hypothetical protein